MKILFLDIDGVLNTNEGTVNHVMVARLRKILENVNVGVVLSSTWRMNHASRLFIKNNVCDFIGVTPYISLEQRGEEIEEWLSWHPNVTRFAILDDQAGWMLQSQQENTFKTDATIGLTDEIVYKIINYLNE